MSVSTIDINSQAVTKASSPAGKSPAERARDDSETPVRNTEATGSTAEAVESSIQRNGRELVFANRRIEFSYDREVDRVIVKVKSADSGEVVRQIPPDEYLRFISQFREQLGVLFDEQF